VRSALQIGQADLKKKQKFFLSKKRDIFAQIRSRPRALPQGARAAEF
jgi:hypothetical protein